MPDREQFRARPITAEPWIVRGIAAANESTRILKADNDAAFRTRHDGEFLCHCHDCCMRANALRVNAIIREWRKS